MTGLAAKLHDATAAYYATHRPALQQGTLLARIPESNWHEQINIVFRGIVEKYSPEAFIVDKTPTIEPLYALEHIQGMWPDAKFIYCRRRGIDNVMSKQRKWPDRPFENHCREWAAVNDLWDEKKKSLRSEWIEVDFFDLFDNGQEVAGRIGKLLALTSAEIELSANRLGATRPQDSSSDMTFVRLSDTGWTDEQSNLFTRICGATMERCGYGLAEYWQSVRSQ